MQKPLSGHQEMILTFWQGKKPSFVLELTICEVQGLKWALVLTEQSLSLFLPGDGDTQGLPLS